MNIAALFGLSVLMSFLAYGIVTRLYVLPRLRTMPREAALTAPVAPHRFRAVGRRLLVPGVVSPPLPAEFAAPAAYGDLVAAILAVIATLALRARASWAIAIVWVFNVWGTLDLLNAIYNGQIGVQIDVRSLGAAFYIPTVIVPALLILHALIFWILLRPKQA